MSAKKGIIYILTNPSLREDWVKIGKSFYLGDVRTKELDNTALPLSFKIFATLKTSKYEEAEKKLHSLIACLPKSYSRLNNGFFNVNPDTALGLLKNVAKTIGDAEITEYEVGRSKTARQNAAASKKRPRFNFRQVDVKDGEKVMFDPAKIEVVVADKNHVEYEGKRYSLTAFAREFMPEGQRVQSGVYQGPRYFSYHGENLDDRRKRLEGK